MLPHGELRHCPAQPHYTQRTMGLPWGGIHMSGEWALPTLSTNNTNPTVTYTCTLICIHTQLSASITHAYHLAAMILQNLAIRIHYSGICACTCMIKTSYATLVVHYSCIHPRPMLWDTTGTETLLAHKISTRMEPEMQIQHGKQGANIVAVPISNQQAQHTYAVSINYSCQSSKH